MNNRNYLENRILKEAKEELTIIKDSGKEDEFLAEVKKELNQTSLSVREIVDYIINHPEYVTKCDGLTNKYLVRGKDFTISQMYANKYCRFAYTDENEPSVVLYTFIHIDLVKFFIKNVKHSFIKEELINYIRDWIQVCIYNVFDPSYTYIDRDRTIDNIDITLHTMLDMVKPN